MGFIQLILLDLLASYQRVNTTPTEPCPVSIKWLSQYSFQTSISDLRRSHALTQFLLLRFEVMALISPSPCAGRLWRLFLSSLPLRPFDISASRRMRLEPRWLIFAFAFPFHTREERDQVWFLKGSSFSTAPWQRWPALSARCLSQQLFGDSVSPGSL